MMGRAPESTGAVTFVIAVIQAYKAPKLWCDSTDAVMLESILTSSGPLHCTWSVSSATDMGWLSQQSPPPSEGITILSEHAICPEHPATERIRDPGLSQQRRGNHSHQVTTIASHGATSPLIHVHLRSTTLLSYSTLNAPNSTNRCSGRVVRYCKRAARAAGYGR